MVTRKIAAGIVRLRTGILIVMLALAVVCAGCIGKTHINYDLTRYLNSETMTRRALDVMQAEFGSSEQLRIMFRDVSADTLSSCVARLNALPEIQLASHDPETGEKTVDGVACSLVTLTLNADCDAAALVTHLREMFPECGEYAVGGAAATQLDVQRSVGEEMPQALLIAVAVVLAVLLLTSHAWLEPVLILVTLGVSILINMGTNFVFPDVSFVTFAVCAILQLALSIDYAIMLLHSFNGLCDEGLLPKDAMIEALRRSFMPVSSSAFTTIAGLLALLFMSFTIGFDIGLVLSKGILISMVTVFLLMPALTLLLYRPLRKTRHRPLQLGGAQLGKAVYDIRRWLAGALALAVAAGAYLQTKNTYIFSDAGRSDAQTESAAINAVFGASDPLVLLVPGGDDDGDCARQRALADALQQIQVADQPAVKEISAMVTTGAAALDYYTAAELAKRTGQNVLAVNLFLLAQGLTPPVRGDRLLEKAGSLAAENPQIAQLQSTLALAKAAFNGPHYSRMLLTLNFPVSSAETRAAIDQIMAAARAEYGEDFYLTGTGMSVYDIGNAFEGDLMLVNLITLAAILLIVALSFRSFVTPLLLVLVIEGAVWITMAVSYLESQPIFFISYLICVAIQMGATIDYGILLTSHYQSFRKTMAPREALCAALHKALPTILTSGAILITAGFIIGKRCSIYYISSIGLLLARGALISVILILTLLPALLTLRDGKEKPKTE
ncbi:MAG: MMPL family transporter [Eubacteriales bacterium]|nr:MMPL family transporter [Eubacteriales bacterium]